MIAAMILNRRTRVIGRHGQEGRRSSELLFPVGQLFLQHRTPQPLALPEGEIGVLERQRRQILRLVPALSSVQCRQFAGQDADGPAIRDAMVHGHDQDMLLVAQAHQQHPPQRAAGQIKAMVGLLVGQPGHCVCLCRVGQRRQIAVVQGEAGRVQLLIGLARALRETGTQHLVARFKLFPTGAKSRQIKRAVHTQRDGNVIRAARPL